MYHCIHILQSWLKTSLHFRMLLKERYIKSFSVFADTEGFGSETKK